MYRFKIGAISALAILTLALGASSAQGIPIHRHLWVHKVTPDGPRKILYGTEKYDVAPAYVPPKPQPIPSTSVVPTGYTTTSPTPTTTTTTSYANVPGVPASFAACVAMAESTNGTNPAAGGNVYGILDPVPGTDPVADPQGAMAALYAQSGTAPWAPYDGC